MELSVTLIIIIITSIISFTAFSNQKIIDDLIFYPPAVTERKQWYRFFSCGLIHADMSHLIFNMFALYIFGAGSAIETPAGTIHTGVEYEFIAIFGAKGKLIYAAMYILALGFCLIPTFSKNKNNYHYRSLGASGAVSAVVFASILLNPTLGMGLFFIPIYIAGFLFGFIYLAVSHYLDKKSQGNVNHSAHIWGALFGIVFLVVACRILSDYPVLQAFIDRISNTNPSEFIQFGR
jgi:membrane associated rhomboid family serine protease